eukprot:UN04810
MNGWNKAYRSMPQTATFNKFTLQLMSIAAPLWLIQLSYEASLDEVRHSQISFDMGNMYMSMD